MIEPGTTLTLTTEQVEGMERNKKATISDATLSHLYWIDVKDRLPDEVKLYLVAFHDMYIDLATFNIDSDWVATSGDVIAVTHWMPLPTSSK